MSIIIKKIIFIICASVFVIICSFYYRQDEDNKISTISGMVLEKKGINEIYKTKKLQVTEITQTEIQDISMMICTEMRKSYRGGYDISKLPDIKEVRHYYHKGNDYYYTVLKDNHGRKLFVFFYDELWFSGVLYMEKQLEFKDFKLLEEGVSTKDDVRKIDSGLDIEQSWGGRDTINDDSSLHMTKEGVVEILYDDTVIKKINFHESSIIKKINKYGDYE